jgi:hypothetical protein
MANKKQVDIASGPIIFCFLASNEFFEESACVLAFFVSK